MDTLRQIAECETVISSSLHGCIAADSLNIPNYRIKLSEHGYNRNIDFKFDDYYTAIHDEKLDYLDFTQDNIPYNLDVLKPENIASQYKINYNRIEWERYVHFWRA